MRGHRDVGAVEQAPARGTDRIMKKMLLLLLLWACTSTCEPLKAAIQRRSDRPGIYASDYNKGYRPYAYMAIPLHAPLPVMRVLSPEPLHRPNRGVQRHMDQPRVYASSMPHTWYAPPPTPDNIILNPVESAPAPEILYARLKPGGGYHYSNRPFKKRAPAKPTEPMIIRIHKYRIIRDD